MKIQSIINGSITIVLEPENGLEEELLKALTKQTCVITEVRTPVTVLGRTIRGSVLLHAAENKIEGVNTSSETKKD